MFFNKCDEPVSTTIPHNAAVRRRRRIIMSHITCHISLNKKGLFHDKKFWKNFLENPGEGEYNIEENFYFLGRYIISCQRSKALQFVCVGKEVGRQGNHTGDR